MPQRCRGRDAEDRRRAAGCRRVPPRAADMLWGYRRGVARETQSNSSVDVKLLLRIPQLLPQAVRLAGIQDTTSLPDIWVDS